MAARNFTRNGGWTTHQNSYRSGLEEKLAAQLESENIPVVFEQYTVPYTIPESKHSYTPDLLLPNGILVEGKGLFDADDRKKHTLIREQHPDLDIRFVFTSSRTKLYKGSPTTYGMWCEKNGFKYADKSIPLEWLKEPTKAIPEGSLLPKKRKEKP